MEIHGSCYCKGIQFTAVSHTPYPYMRCYCNFCRKTAGSGGYGINIMAEHKTLQVTGEELLRFHHGLEHDSVTDELVENENKRFFCSRCGSGMWAHDPRWSEWFYPYAACIDTPLPQPPETVHIMLDFMPSWVRLPEGAQHSFYARYPSESIEQWHRRLDLYQDS